VAGLLLLICYTVTSAVFTFASTVITLSLHINEKDWLSSASRLFGFSQLFGARENFYMFVTLWEVYLKSLTGRAHPKWQKSYIKLHATTIWGLRRELKLGSGVELLQGFSLC
jgi:hypothetical protein